MRLEKLGNDFYCMSGGRVLKNTGALPVDTCVQLSVGIPAYQIEKLSMYPNPTTGGLTINLPDKWNTGTMISIALLDLRGALVVSEQLRAEGQTLNLDLNGLASGSYILNLSNSKEVRRSLVVKE